MFKILVIAALAVSSNALTTISLPEKVEFGWLFPTNQTVKFSLFVPNSKIGQSDWEWYGIGIQTLGSDLGMNDADLVTVSFDSGLIESRTSAGDTYPPVDKESGFILTGSVILEGVTEFTWTRNLNTKLKGDIELVIGGKYDFIYASGPLSMNGKTAMHKTSGKTVLELKYDNSLSRLSTKSGTVNLLTNFILLAALQLLFYF
ncbi:unnamed protein product [Blepharisma stoltei]|uniref:DOMON domain-containing protein n=1 Tax=Blepharisma stoltei TaxID=1481888 RepID=A0AAU9IJT9_9CILI|nr:unnamed protein product [Blepharisma stoltei]